MHKQRVSSDNILSRVIYYMNDLNYHERYCTDNHNLTKNERYDIITNIIGIPCNYSSLHVVSRVINTLRVVVGTPTPEDLSSNRARDRLFFSPSLAVAEPLLVLECLTCSDWGDLFRYPDHTYAVFENPVTTQLS